MSDELKPPVAIRITRPYDTEEQYLEREFDTLTRTSIVLLGAQQRPQGVVLRFEIVLKTGGSLVRGEGRVVGYKERAYGGEPGLTLRFTRLDSKSKTLVDQAATLREARVRASTSLMSMPAVVVPRPGEAAVPSSPPQPAPLAKPPSEPPARAPTPLPPSRKTPPPLPVWARVSSPPLAVIIPAASSSGLLEVDVEAEGVDELPSSTQITALPIDLAELAPEPPPPPAAIPPRPPSPPPLPPRPVGRPPLPLAVPSSPPPPLDAPPPAPPPVSAPVAALAPPPAPSPPFVSPHVARTHGGNGSGGRTVAAPADRDALLDRLRTRARTLAPDVVRAVLAKHV